MTDVSPLRIALIASSRFPIVEPFAGGLEAHVWMLAGALRARGHLVTLFAAPGSDRRVAQRHHAFAGVGPGSALRRLDLSDDPRLVKSENDAYRSLMSHLILDGGALFDVVHNHSLHHLPITLAHKLIPPVVSTLHTPPIQAIERAMRRVTARRSHFVAVSRHTADSWHHASPQVGVVHNGIDTSRWRRGPGGGPLVWSGRLVPEKGAHLAIDAARLAGRPLELAGPIIDQAYFDCEIAPRLGADVRYLGHLDQRALAAVVGRASVALVTPTWAEPYGLVVAEALACGTPVAAFRRGGIPEILTPACGRLAEPDDVADLARAVTEAATLSRAAARSRAVTHCSVLSMVDSYVDIYRSRIAADAMALQ